MLYLTVLMKVEKENENEFLEIVKMLIEATRQEDGCNAYYLTKMNSDTYNYVLHEVWENQAALDAHNNTEHFKTYVPQLDSLSEVLIPLIGKKL